MSKITQSARGQECQVRLDGICNHDSDTTVFAHIGGGGMGTKQPDTEGAFCCSDCHNEVDRRTTRILNPLRVSLYHHEGCMRTRKILIDMGLIEIK